MMEAGPVKNYLNFTRVKSVRGLLREAAGWIVEAIAPSVKIHIDAKSQFIEMARLFFLPNPSFIDVANSLKSLHQAGLVYSDLKPAHLMQDQDARMFLVDRDQVCLSGGPVMGSTVPFCSAEAAVGMPAHPLDDLVSVFLLRLFSSPSFDEQTKKRLFELPLTIDPVGEHASFLKAGVAAQLELFGLLSADNLSPELQPFAASYLSLCFFPRLPWDSELEHVAAKLAVDPEHITSDDLELVTMRCHDHSLPLAQCSPEFKLLPDAYDASPETGSRRAQLYARPLRFSLA